jgi:hypothetical protein
MVKKKPLLDVLGATLTKLMKLDKNQFFFDPVNPVCDVMVMWCGCDVM